MDSAMIGKIEKSKRYAEQPERFQFMAFSVEVTGKNNTHITEYNRGEWACGCSFFQSRNRCVHTMSLERILGEMIPK